MIRLKHSDIVTFGFMSRYNGVLQASYRVRSAISETLEIGGDPGRVTDKVMLERTQAQVGTEVKDRDVLLIEGKYFQLTLDGDVAKIAQVGAGQAPTPEKPA